MANVFVSYGHEDEAAARTLKGALEERGNEVGDTVQSANVVVLLIGNKPSTSVRNEWSEALAELWRDNSMSVVPVVLPGAKAPAFLRDQQTIRVDGTPGDWERVARLTENPEQVSFAGTTTESARSELAERLNEIEAIAHSLPDTPDEIG